MDNKNLGNYRSDISNLPEDPAEPEESESPKAEDISGDDIRASVYHQEINTLKIEKLSQRITIISVILPCIIIAILAFAYIDMKERVVDVDQTQGSHMAQISKALEEKLNALDVRIAKATFDLDEKLALTEKKSQALENQAAKMSSNKADLKAMDKALAKLEKRIKTNAGQDKVTLAAMERVNRQLQAAIKENNVQFKSKADQIKDEIQLFKEEFDARLLELSAYEQQIDQLTKSTGLLDKQIKTLKQETELIIDRKLTKQYQSYEKAIKGLETKIKSLSLSQSPEPVVVTPDTPKAAASVKTPPPQEEKPAQLPDSDEVKTSSGCISEQTLNQ